MNYKETIEMTEIKSNILDFIDEYIAEEVKNIKKEKNTNKNISKAFSRGTGGFGEELSTFIIPSSYVSASKGGGAFDNFELDEAGNIKCATEVKTCCHIQPKECKKCSKKAPYFQEMCVFCGKKEFKIIKDSRFGIDSKAHFDYEDLLTKYLLVYIDIDGDDRICLNVYVIDSKNKYFTNYLRNQKDNSNKSNTCNLVPHSYDFYASGPVPIIEMKYDLNGVRQYENIDIFNKKPLDFNISCLNKKELEQLGINEGQVVPYEFIKDTITIRNKKLNKPRGKTTRI